MIQLDRVITGYLAAIEFTDYENDCTAAESEAAEDCADFLRLCYEYGLDLSGISDDQIGIDFWLTRNRHGAGFWDRGLGKLGDQLTEIAQDFGAVDCIPLGE